jgi:sec-independent protein translocase protein TatC
MAARTEGKEMSFLEHLEELRWVFVRSAIAIVACMILVFTFSNWLFDRVILAPQRADFITYRAFCHIGRQLGLGDKLCINDVGFTFQNQNMGGQFMADLTVSLVGGLILAMPFVLYQIWRFVAPGLRARERNAVGGVVWAIAFLFMIGVAFGYFVLVPMSIQFLGNYRVGSTNAVANEINLDSFIGTITSLALWTGIVFQLPLVVVFLTRLGLAGPGFLRTYRKHAYVLILVVAAIITPPDVTSQILVSLPLILLYEVSIFLAARVQKKQLAEERMATKAVQGA